MAIDTQLLRTLHRILRQKTDLNDQLARGPRRLKIALNGEAEFTKRLEEAKATLQKMKMAASEKELQLKSREAKIEELKGKLNSCESNREFTLLKDQIAADTQANSVLGDEILELLDKIETQESAIVAADENLEKAKQESLKVREDVESRQALLKAELERVSAELAEHERQLPMDIRDDYNRRVVANGENALAAVEDDVCGNCSYRISIQVRSQLQLAKPTLCNSCDSLLYLAESTQVGG